MKNMLAEGWVDQKTYDARKWPKPLTKKTSQKCAR
jgi:hypothetical protein